MKEQCDYSAIKLNEILTHATTQLTLENITPTLRSQPFKKKKKQNKTHTHTQTL